MPSLGVFYGLLAFTNLNLDIYRFSIRLYREMYIVGIFYSVAIYAFS